MNHIKLKTRDSVLYDSSVYKDLGVGLAVGVFMGGLCCLIPRCLRLVGEFGCCSVVGGVE